MREELSELKDELIEEFKKSHQSVLKLSGWTIHYKHRETDRLAIKEDDE